jgi:glycosyltransferase involved in cell wall biosynthesis
MRGASKILIVLGIMVHGMVHGIGEGMGAREPKIVALLPARNEAALIVQCIKALAQYADAIVYLDDASDDNSVTLVQSIAVACRVEKIITKSVWDRNEPADRNALLQAGRALGGTHFIVLDADELFTANCMDNDFLKKRILALQPGDRLLLNWISLWRSIHEYRFDESVWTNNYKDFVFCDDGTCSYSSAFINTPRTPADLRGKNVWIEGYIYGVLHFQFVNWRNLCIKQAWYRCLERIKNPTKEVSYINQLYAPATDESNLRVAPSPDIWFAAYDFFDASVYAMPTRWREVQMYTWFARYGTQFFKDLAIWDVIGYREKNKKCHSFLRTMFIRFASTV